MVCEPNSIVNHISSVEGGERGGFTNKHYRYKKHPESEQKFVDHTLLTEVETEATAFGSVQGGVAIAETNRVM